MLNSLESIVNSLVTSANFKAGKVAKAVYEQLEAAGTKITPEVKQAVYSAVDKRITALLPIGKHHMILACSTGGYITSEGDVVKRGMVRTQDTRELSHVEQLKLAKEMYYVTQERLWKSKKDDNSGLERKLRKIRNTMNSILFILELSKNPEDKTLAANYRKFLEKLAGKETPEDKTPEVSSIVTTEEAKQS